MNRFKQSIGSLTLAAGLFLPGAAHAASHIDFSGSYTVAFISEANFGNYGGDRGFTDNYFGHWYDFNFTFSPTDEISVYWLLRVPNYFSRWGASIGVETTHIYGEIKKPWGTISIGKLSEAHDNYGLDNLGYHPYSSDWGLQGLGPFDYWDAVTGIEYKHDWDNGFGFYAQFARRDNFGFGYDALSSDYDNDRYIIEPRYKWDNGGVALGIMYERNAEYDGRDENGDKFHNAVDKTKTWSLSPSIMHQIGNFSFHAEGKFGWGKIDYQHQPGQADPKSSTDVEGYAAYLDFDYNFGPGNVTLAGWWASGTDLNEADKPNGKSKSAIDLGSEFFPLLVAYNYYAWGYNRLSGTMNTNAIALANNGFENYIQPNRATMLTPGFSPSSIPGVTNGGTPNQTVGASGRERWTSFNNNTEVNNWAIALFGNYAITEDVGLRLAVAYMGLNKSNYRILNSYKLTGVNGFDNLGYKEQSKDLGWEADIALSLQLLDNLTFSSSFGYMFTGDAFKSIKGYEVGAADTSGSRQVKAVWQDPDNSYTWYNALTFSF